MLRYALDSGINFIDIAYLHDTTEYERLCRVIGRAFDGGYRDKTRLAVTLPPDIAISPGLEDRVSEILEWLRTDRIDFFAVGRLDRKNWPKLKESNFFPQAESSISKGLIRFLGFAFHDQYHFLRDVITGYADWRFCRLDYSFMDIDHHPGVSGLTCAVEQGLAVVVTEPLKGGRLVKNIPETVARVWAEASLSRSPAEWGLRFVWNHPEVSVAISDMASMEQLKENVVLAESAGPEYLTIREQVVIGNARDAYSRLKPIKCTACRNCMPCHLGIDVPRIFELYNDAVMYNDSEGARTLYKIEGHRIEDCDRCGACATACGRQIPIIDWLDKAHNLFTKQK